MRLTLDGFCLSATGSTDTVFQTSPSSDTSNPTLLSARRKRKRAHLYVNTHQQQHHNSATPPRKRKKKKKKPKLKTQKREKHKHSDCRQTDTRHKAERRHTRSHLPGTQRKLTDKHTKQRAQSTAQPEVYFMQEYSKVCFTIQLNIKGGYIPLWSLTPQWTNPRHPPSTYSTHRKLLNVTANYSTEDRGRLCIIMQKAGHIQMYAFFLPWTVQGLCYLPRVIFLKFEG